MTDSSIKPSTAPPMVISSFYTEIDQINFQIALVLSRLMELENESIVGLAVLTSIQREPEKIQNVFSKRITLTS